MSDPGSVGRYRMRRALELFVSREGDAYLLRGGSGQEHVVWAPDAADLDLLRRLVDGPVAIRAGSVEAARVQPLIDAGAVLSVDREQALSSVDQARFDRQLPYFEDHGDPGACQRRLRDARVGVIGCGGLGTWAIGALATAGVGRFVLVDDDTIELSNLNRQVLYDEHDLGRDKVHRAADWLRRFDSSIEVDAVERHVTDSRDLDVLGACDVWLLLADDPPYLLARHVDEAARRHGLPYVAAGQQPPLVKVGPTYRWEGGACYACHELHVREDFPLYDDLVAARIRRPPPATTLGPASALVGSLLATEVFHLLSGGDRPATADRMLTIDIRTFEARWLPVERHPACSRHDD